VPVPEDLARTTGTSGHLPAGSAWEFRLCHVSEDLVNKFLLIGRVHLFPERFSPSYNFVAVLLNYLRTLTIKIGVDDSGHPRGLDCLPIIDLQQ
jgi:hypothetical protein